MKEKSYLAEEWAQKEWAEPNLIDKGWDFFEPYHEIFGIPFEAILFYVMIILSGLAYAFKQKRIRDYARMKRVLIKKNNFAYARLVQTKRYFSPFRDMNQTYVYIFKSGSNKFKSRPLPKKAQNFFKSNEVKVYLNEKNPKEYYIDIPENFNEGLIENL